MKEESNLKEWPNLTGEGEYDHIQLIRSIDILKEYYSRPDELVHTPLSIKLMGEKVLVDARSSFI